MFDHQVSAYTGASVHCLCPLHQPHWTSTGMLFHLIRGHFIFSYIIYVVDIPEQAGAGWEHKLPHFQTWFEYLCTDICWFCVQFGRYPGVWGGSEDVLALNPTSMSGKMSADCTNTHTRRHNPPKSDELDLAAIWEVIRTILTQSATNKHFIYLLRNKWWFAPFMAEI